MSDYFNSIDVMILILKFLPVKTLIRFQAVCKSWKQVISSKSLALHHLSLQIPRNLVVRMRFGDRETFHLFDPQTLPSFQTLIPPAPVKSEFRNYNCILLNIAHGVICLYHNTGYILWNPSIRRLRPVPLPESARYHTNFKIVLYHYLEGFAVLFSSKKQEWTEIRDGPQIGYQVRPVHVSWQVLVDGVAHWITYKYPNGGVIVSFDFGLDRPGVVELPDDFVMRWSRYGPSIFKWRDCLSVADYDVSCSHKYVVWARQNGLWSQMFSLKLQRSIIDSVLYVLESRGKVLVLTNTGRLVLCDSEYGCSLVESKFVDGGGSSSLPYEFVESLVFPDHED